MILLTLLLIPVIVAAITFILGKHKVTWQEFTVQMLASLLIAAVSMWAMFSASTHDVEVYNGRITDKKQVRVSCSHSYTCNCRTVCSGSGKTRSCSTICQTCYEHSNDWDWRVYTNIGESFNIDRVDRRGKNQPPRWTSVKSGEPYSSTHSYTNYVKASPDSLFQNKGAVEKYKGKLPNYPQKIYDYHRLDRVITVDLSLKDIKEWNSDLSEINADLGPKAEANVILLITKNVDQDYFYAVRQHWIGGKKNDIIAVIGVDDSNNIQWSEILAWSKDKMFEVVLRDHILGLKTLDRQKIMQHIKTDTLQYFKRKPMSEYEYLKSAVTPTTTQWIIAMLVQLITSVGIGIFMYKNDIEEYQNRRRYY